jgi:hypothetical protein
LLIGSHPSSLSEGLTLSRSCSDFVLMTEA